MSDAPEACLVRVHVLGQEPPALEHLASPERAAEIVRDFQVGTTRVLSIGNVHFDRRHVTHVAITGPGPRG